MAGRRIQPLSEMMQQAVAEGVFCAGVLQVNSRGRTVHRSAHGFTSLWPGAGPVRFDTCFDLASLTKPLATTTVVLKLVQQGVLGLEQRVGRWLPRAASARATIAQLLEHSSGLPAWRPYFYEVASSPAAWARSGLTAIRRLAAGQRPERPSGQRACYSDIGFILLEWIIERAAGQRLDRLFRHLVARYLPRPGLFFPVTSGLRRRHRFAATELCPWRGRVLCGWVHDDNAFVMGGVSGHAGLFGTAEAVAALAGHWLDAWRGRRNWLPTALVQRFWRRSPQPGSSRTLGWDKPSGENSQAGRLLGPATVGHTGFTGTSLWVDPERQLVIVLLTNRVHPDRNNLAIRQFRPRLHDLVAKVVDK